MSRRFVPAFAALLAAGLMAGCQDKSRTSDADTVKPMNASVDVCDHCPGVQTATTDGKCPMCGAKVPGPASPQGRPATMPSNTAP